MSKSVSFCSLCSRQYLPTALTACKSLHEHHPDTSIFLLLVDISWIDLSLLSFHFPFVQFISYESLVAFEEIPTFYNDLELCCSLKPLLISHLSDTLDVDFLIYFDSDSWFVRPFISELINIISSHSVILFPHINHICIKDEFLSLRHGLFNAGFIVCNLHTCQSFLSWWSDRCRSHCFLEPNQNLFVDQNWLSLVPFLFDNVLIFKDPLFLNIGYWNFKQASSDIVAHYHLSGWISNDQEITADSLFSRFSDALVSSHIENLSSYNYYLNQFTSFLDEIDFQSPKFLPSSSLTSLKVQPLTARLEYFSKSVENKIDYYRSSPPSFVRYFCYSILRFIVFIRCLNLFSSLLMLLNYVSRSSFWSPK